MKKTGAKPNIKFSDIRQLEGKQDKGFEELCVQLLPLLVGEKPTSVVRIEGRGGDGGVEAIASLLSGHHVGLQSKFFSTLHSSQWTQIQESVSTAVDKHPELTRYLICVPLDRTPDQIKKWRQFVVRWGFSQPTLLLEWVGTSELLRHLIKDESNDLLTYWFGCPSFSLEWVAQQTETAIVQLHDRYTPMLHQTTSSELRLGAYAATAKASYDHRQLCSNLVVAWRKVLQKLPRAVSKSGRSASLDKLDQAIRKMQVDMREGHLVEQTDELVQSLAQIEVASKSLIEGLFPSSSEGDADRDPVPDFFRETELDVALDQISQVSDAVREFISVQLQDIWILRGEAGSRKSHLMANLAKNVLTEQRCCLLLIGERFASTSPPAEQIPSLLSWDGSMRELCACLSTHAAISGKSSLLMIDAINESPQRGLWKRELPQLVALVKEFPGVRLLVSCRSDCVDSSIPPSLLNEVATVVHHGFDLNFHEAVKAYFDGYRVVSPQFPTMNAEFRNPLFLKTLCEAYHDRTIPSGALSFVRVLEEWENRIAEQIRDRIDCPVSSTRDAINDIVRAMCDSSEPRMRAEVAREICLKRFNVATESQSLYRQLNSSGLLQEIETSNGVHVRLQYERFSDVRTAQLLLQRFRSKREWLSYWKLTLLPSITGARGVMDYEAGPRLFALALLLPTCFGLELVECPIATSIREPWQQAQAKDDLWAAWLDALSWRALERSEQKIRRYFSLWTAKQRSDREIWEQLFQFSCVPNHPLNADFLHRNLLRWALPQRELNWTIALATESLDDQTGGSAISPFLFWAEASTGKSTNEQVRLAVTVLLWLTSSPNRQLRDRASDIAIRLLIASASGELCIVLLKDFWDVDDPYVKERLLAVISGAVPQLEINAVRQVAQFIADKFWRQRPVAPHILQREYAALVIRHATNIGALAEADAPTLRNETRVPKPKVWTELQVKAYEDQQGYHSIRRSLQPEETGHYGDFGRYVMGSAVHHFADDDKFEPAPKGIGRGGKEHDARWAKHYIWQRVVELGWTPERYSKYEDGIGYRGRMNDSGIERISKKYQWIGLHEYLGLLSDSLLVREWNGSEHRLRGAWELGVRDYDPGNATLVREQQESEALSPLFGRIETLQAANTVEEKRAWVTEDFLPFEQYLTIVDEGQKWIVLHAHFQLDEQLGFGFDKEFSGQKSQWIDIRAFIVPTADLPKRFRALRKLDFRGNGCFLPSVSQCWITEYPWHPMFDDLDADCRNNDTWFRRSNQKLFLPVCEISNDGRHVLLPAPTLHRELGAALGSPLSAPRYCKDGLARIYGRDMRCMFRGSTQGTRHLVVNAEAMHEYLRTQKCSLVWAVLSEKSAWDGGNHVGGLANQCAVYVLGDEGHTTGGHTVRQVDHASPS